tara:strand:- start:1140 stop:1286 length:147 start_codon:yes stop_codon:yes gene_type:complete
MGNKVFDVQEDIIELMNTGKSIEEVKEIIEETHGSLYVEMVEEVVSNG